MGDHGRKPRTPRRRELAEVTIGHLAKVAYRAYAGEDGFASLPSDLRLRWMRVASALYRSLVARG